MTARGGKYGRRQEVYSNGFHGKLCKISTFEGQKILFSMGAGIDKKLVLEYYQRMTDEQISVILTNDVKGLTAEAQEIVRDEIKRRNLDPEILKAVEAQQVVHVHIPKAYDPEAAPVDEERRLWLDRSFQFLLDLYGKENTKQRRILTPDSAHFPILYDGSERSASDTLKIIAHQMEVPFESITLDFYEDDIQLITEGNPNGMYWGAADNGNFEISVARNTLDFPEKLVATLAHEVAHIKLLGENRIEENDEFLTDLTTIFFGLGIFNANSAFQSHTDERYYVWSTAGYLSQMEWGYALALFAFSRGETDPPWVKYLCSNVQGDFKQAKQFMLNNEDKIGVAF